MRLLLDNEQRQLADTVRELLADHSPPERVREVMNGTEGCDRKLWHRIGRDLGLTGLVVPERHGGSGAGQVERGVVLHELGRTLAPVPFFASAVLCVDVVLALDDPATCAELLPGLATGSLVGAVGVAADDGSWGSSATTVTARERQGEWVLDGHVSFVLFGQLADVVLVYAATPAGPGWFVVDAMTAEPHRTSLHSMDPTRGMARFDFANTPARLVPCADATAALDAVRDRAEVALAAEHIGGMSRVLEMVVDYATTRVQFGRPIGSYQAVKHACADLYVAFQQADSVVRYAAWSADHAPAELPVAASMCAVIVGPAYFRAAADGVQLHGGLGYTWEHDAHLYYKRAKTGELLLGTADEAHLRLADRLLRATA